MEVAQEVFNKKPTGSQYDMDEKDNRIRNWTVATVLAAIGLVFPINRAYVDWHVTLIQDVVTESVGGLQESIAVTQQTANESANKIDFLVKAEAARNVESLTTQLILIKSANTGTPNELRAIGEMEQKIDRAITYRDCVINDRPNCDALRVW